VRILVTGGVRSGKSRHAEELLADAGSVTYLAPGRTTGGRDTDWDARIAAHRARRPASWRTVETVDVAAALADADGAVLLDDLGSWVVGVVDDAGLWDAASAQVHEAVDERLDALCGALVGVPHAVVVTSEVGLGVLPAHHSGVLFADLLGGVNQRVATVCAEVHLVVAGRVLRL
jgi:adenosylcobinamide kinase / adenosylcobinamide-phosphate guanylyltransferase